MISTYRYKGAVWLDVDHPTREDIEQVVETYKIDKHVAHELLVPTSRSCVEFYEESVYISLRFPAFKHSRTKEEIDQEIDFIIAKNALITARFDAIDALHSFSKTLETESVIDKTEVENPAEYIFFRMIRQLYDAISNELTYIDGWTNEIETKVFKGQEKEMVRTLSDAGRVLIDFRRVLLQHDEIFKSLLEYGHKTNNKNFTHSVKEILVDYEKIMHTIESQQEIVHELRETNNALLNTEQSEIAKVITVLAFIAVPISLVIGIFQIDSASRPIIGMENDFWILIGLVVLLGAAMFAFFRYEKWL